MEASLLWVDLEMTGLVPGKDKILEVAAVATGWDLKPVAEFSGVARVDPEVIAERMRGEFWEKNKESYDSLVAQNESGETAAEVEKKLLKFIDENFGEEVYLAGNSIHQDRRFIDAEWEEVSRRLHYRMLDVSAWKVVFEHLLGVKFMKPEEHRAVSDIAGSIAELQYYLRFVGKNKLKTGSVFEEILGGGDGVSEKVSGEAERALGGSND